MKWAVYLDTGFYVEASTYEDAIDEGRRQLKETLDTDGLLEWMVEEDGE